MVYYGQTLNTPNLYGDMYINFFIGQMVEIPSVIATWWFIHKYVNWSRLFVHTIDAGVTKSIYRQADRCSEISASRPRCQNIEFVLIHGLYPLTDCYS